MVPWCIVTSAGRMADMKSNLKPDFECKKYFLVPLRFVWIYLSLLFLMPVKLKYCVLFTEST